MGAMEVLMRKYRRGRKISLEEFQKAKNELSTEELKRNYVSNGGGYYKYEYPTESEMQLMMLDSITDKVKFIYGLSVTLLVFFILSVVISILK